MGRSTQQTNAPAQDSAGWVHATRLLERYLKSPQKADSLLATLPDSLDSAARAQCQFLFLGVLRNLALLEAAVNTLCRRKPRPGLRAVLLVASFELLQADGGGQHALAVHHAVQMSKRILSQGESGFVNAILRRVPGVLERIIADTSDPVERLALKYSHPQWLVSRWLLEFGEERVSQLLEWNQTPPPVYVRLEGAMTPPKSLEPTPWPSFHRYRGPGWAEIDGLLRTQQAYVQDPSTGHPIDLLSLQPGETVLDLCAAPGGKGRHLLSRLRGKGILVCLDLPGRRMEVLKENIPERSGDLDVRLVGMDLLEATPETFAKMGLPSVYDAVLIDAPCSNTGVLRRRPDARWRLQEGDIEAVAEVQAKLLRRAAPFVKEGGRLVYSTCSIETVENGVVAEKFVNDNPPFRETARKLSYPWDSDHDGGAAFRFDR